MILGFVVTPLGCGITKVVRRYCAPACTLGDRCITEYTEDFLLGIGMIRALLRLPHQRCLLMNL